MAHLAICEVERGKFDKIVPGVTTLSEIGGGSVINKDGNRRSGNYVIQRGDLISSRGRRAYVLRKGETRLPWYIQKFWEDNDKIREIFRRTSKWVLRQEKRWTSSFVK